MQSKLLKSIRLPKFSFDSIPLSKELILLGLAVVAFLFLNIFIAKSVLGPAKKHFNELREIESLMRTKPHLEFLLQDGNQLLSDWKTAASPVEGAAVILKEIQDLASEYHIHVKEITSKRRQNTGAESINQVAGATFARQSIALEAIGSFHDLARWIDVVEDKPGLFIENWHLNSTKEGPEANRLALNLNVISNNS